MCRKVANELRAVSRAPVMKPGEASVPSIQHHLSRQVSKFKEELKEVTNAATAKMQAQSPRAAARASVMNDIDDDETAPNSPLSPEGQSNGAVSDRIGHVVKSEDEAARKDRNAEMVNTGNGQSLSSGPVNNYVVQGKDSSMPEIPLDRHTASGLSPSSQQQDHLHPGKYSANPNHHNVAGNHTHPAQEHYSQQEHHPQMERHHSAFEYTHLTAEEYPNEMNEAFSGEPMMDAEDSRQQAFGAATCTTFLVNALLGSPTETLFSWMHYSPTASDARKQENMAPSSATDTNQPASVQIPVPTHKVAALSENTTNSSNFSPQYEDLQNPYTSNASSQAPDNKAIIQMYLNRGRPQKQVGFAETAEEHNVRPSAQSIPQHQPVSVLNESSVHQPSATPPPEAKTEDSVPFESPREDAPFHELIKHKSRVHDVDVPVAGGLMMQLVGINSDNGDIAYLKISKLSRGRNGKIGAMERAGLLEGDIIFGVNGLQSNESSVLALAIKEEKSLLQLNVLRRNGRPIVPLESEHIQALMQSVKPTVAPVTPVSMSPVATATTQTAAAASATVPPPVIAPVLVVSEPVLYSAAPAAASTTAATPRTPGSANRVGFSLVVPETIAPSVTEVTTVAPAAIIALKPMESASKIEATVPSLEEASSKQDEQKDETQGSRPALYSRYSTSQETAPHSSVSSQQSSEHSSHLSSQHSSQQGSQHSSHSAPHIARQISTQEPVSMDAMKSILKAVSTYDTFSVVIVSTAEGLGLRLISFDPTESGQAHDDIARLFVNGFKHPPNEAPAPTNPGLVAGVKPGDFIEAVNGLTFRSCPLMIEAIKRCRADLELTIRRKPTAKAQVSVNPVAQQADEPVKVAAKEVEAQQSSGARKESEVTKQPEVSPVTVVDTQTSETASTAISYSINHVWAKYPDPSVQRLHITVTVPSNASGLGIQLKRAKVNPENPMDGMSYRARVTGFARMVDASSGQLIMNPGQGAGVCVDDIIDAVNGVTAPTKDDFAKLVKAGGNVVKLSISRP
jgi:C-terminal processing protease CtpA/Prc